MYCVLFLHSFTLYKIEIFFQVLFLSHIIYILLFIMNTRHSENSSVAVVKRFILECNASVQKYNQQKNALTDIQRIETVNAQMLHVIRHMDHLIRVTSTSTNNLHSMERLFQVLLDRKKVILAEMANFAKKPANETVAYQTKCRCLTTKLKKISNKIHSYYNRKYSMVLMKTNSDVYRKILSYL